MTSASDEIYLLGENLDRLASLEIARPSGVKLRLYEAARAKLGKPLAYVFADGIAKHVKAKENVIIACGSVSLPWMAKGETDGPPGAAVVARALDVGLNAKPIIVCEDALVDMVEATFAGAGLTNHTYNDFRATPHSVMVQGFPLDDAKAKVEAERLLREYSPSAVIAIEKMGPNRKGVHHTVRGYDVSATRAKVYNLVDRARSQGTFTGGVGDGGNEIGFGTIFEEARRILPTGAKCNCPCGDGMVTATATDALIVASASNYGAYGIAACLAAMLNRIEVFHDRATEQRMLHNCVNAGAVDGNTTWRTPTVDGVSEEADLAIVDLMRTMISFPREAGTREKFGLV